MEGIFLKIVEMSIAGSVCIVAVLALRVLLRRLPKVFSYMLWAVVFLRLLCPLSLQSRHFGLTLGDMDWMLEAAAYEQELVEYQVLIHKDGTLEAIARHGRLGTSAQVAEEELSYARNNTVGARYSHSAVLRQERGWVTMASMIWAAGVAVVLGYSVVSYVLLRRRLAQAVRIQEDVYESDRISTPFLLGFLDSRIYLPMGLEAEEKACVLAHELVHLKRGDYLVKMVTWMTLCLHWFNPLVWLAYSLMVRDMEMSCDESVIRKLGKDSKKVYSQTLLAISEAGEGSLVRKLLPTAPLSFGEEDIQSRVRNILAYRSVKVTTAILLALLLAVTAVVLLTNQESSSLPEGGDLGKLQGMGEPAVNTEQISDTAERDGSLIGQDIRQLGDWVSSWEIPHEEMVQVGSFQANVLLSGGVLFHWKEEKQDLEESWDWGSAGGFGPWERVEQSNEPFVFDSSGQLIDLVFYWNHSSPNGSAERLDGCQEQAVLLSMNHDLYTVSELYEREEAGNPVPEEEITADFWYIGFAREDAPWGYVLFLAQRYFTKEEAIAMARSIHFTEEAWGVE